MIHRLKGMISGDRRNGGDQLDNGGPGHDVDGMEIGVDNVLVLARTGLIFTRSQEGAQLSGLAQPQPGQTEPGIPYHVPSSWVPVGGRGAGGSLSWFGSARRRSCPGERVCCAVRVVFSPYLYHCFCCSLCLPFC